MPTGAKLPDKLTGKDEVIFVHDSSSTYLTPADLADIQGKPILTFNQDPLPPSSRWRIVAAGGVDNAYHITSAQNHLYLTANPHQRTLHPTLEHADAGSADRQLWYFRPMFGSDIDFAIIPKSVPGYALGPMQYVFANLIWIAPIRMWAGIPALSQAWIIVVAPNE